MKYIRCLLQLILAIPFYYVSMVTINFLMSIINELSRLFEKGNGKMTQKLLSEFKFDITNIFHYIPEYNYIYALLGLFLAYFLIFIPIRDLYKEIKHIGKNVSNKNKAENKKIRLENEQEKKPTDTYKGKDALEIMSEQTRKELGNKQQNTESENKQESSIRKERKSPLENSKLKKEEPVKINSEELYEEDEDFFLSQLQGTTTRIDKNANEILQDESKPSYEEVTSNSNDISEFITTNIQQPKTFEELMEEKSKKDLEQIKLNKIEQEKVRKKLSTLENS